MASKILQKKSSDQMLSDVQDIGYPQITSFSWGANGTVTIEADVMTQGMLDDVMEYSRSTSAWEWVDA